MFTTNLKNKPDLISNESMLELGQKNNQIIFNELRNRLLNNVINLDNQNPNFENCNTPNTNQLSINLFKRQFEKVNNLSRCSSQRFQNKYFAGVELKPCNQTKTVSNKIRRRLSYEWLNSKLTKSGNYYLN